MLILPKPTAPESKAEPLLVPAKIAAEMLSICQRTLWQLTKDGRIPVIKVGAKKLYSVEMLRRFANGDPS